MRVAVIGAGISGLAAAHFLKKAGADVIVLEKKNGPGGTIETKVLDGFLVESGPNSTSETNLIIDEVLSDLSMPEEKVYADESSKFRFILRGGKLHALPSGPGSFLSTRLWTWGGKMRLFAEPFIGRAGHEESVADFVTRRLGREFLDYAINPFVAGVYAGNPSELSVRAAFPKLYALEEKYGGLLKGTINGARERKKRPDKARVSAKLFAFRSGMGILPRRLADSLGDRVQFNASTESVAYDGTKFSVRVSTGRKSSDEVFDKVVLAVPSYAAAGIVKAWLPALSSELAKIKYPPVAVAVLGYKREQVGIDLTGFGFLVPEIEKRRILGTIWSSSIFPNRAPEGFVELTTFIGGSRQPKLVSLSDDEISKIAHQENALLMKIQGLPVFTAVTKWERAIPQYNIGHLAILDAVKYVETLHKGLYFSNNFKDGISVADCIANGKKVADKILEESTDHSVTATEGGNA